MLRFQLLALPQKPQRCTPVKELPSRGLSLLCVAMTVRESSLIDCFWATAAMVGHLIWLLFM